MSLRESLILGIMAASSGGLWAAWASDPHVRAGPLAALLWCLAVWRAHPDPDRPRGPRGIAVWRAGAIGTLLTSRVLELDVLAHLGLAAWACAAARGRPLLVFAAASWIPVLGYHLAPLTPEAGNAVRLSLAAVALALVEHGGVLGGEARAAQA